MSPRKQRFWLAAVIVTPTIVAVAIIVATRGFLNADKGSQPQPSANAITGDGYTISSTMGPVWNGALDQPITSATQLPTPRDCEDALTWTHSEGNAAVNMGHAVLRLSASRNLQVKVNKVSVSVTSRAATSAKTIIQCDTSDWRGRWITPPGDENYKEDLRILDNSYQTTMPWIKIDPNRTGAIDVDYDDPTQPLAVQLLTVEPGKRLILPFYIVADLEASPELSLVNLTLMADISVNGKPVIYTNNLRLNVIPPAASIPRFEWLTDERRWVKDRAFDPAKAAPQPAAGSYLCEFFTDSQVREVLQRATFDRWRVGNDHCVWVDADGRGIQLGCFDHLDEIESKAHYDRVAELMAMPTPSPSNAKLPGVGDDAVILRDEFGQTDVYIRLGRSTISITMYRGTEAPPEVMLELARAAVSQPCPNTIPRAITQ